MRSVIRHADVSPAGPSVSPAPLLRRPPQGRLDGMFTAALLLTLALAPADAPTPPPEAAVSDAGELQGEWEVVSMFTQHGDMTRAFKGGRWIFAGMTLRLVSPKGSGLGPYALHIKPYDPSEVEYVDERCKCFADYYRRAGDVLLCATCTNGKGKPPSFDPAPGVEVWTLRRVKK